METENSMIGTKRFWKAILPMFVVVFSLAFMAGCKEKSEHPTGPKKDHQAKEGAKTDHPAKTDDAAKEGAKTDHPKTDHPK
jgi:hypothetical protein